MGVGRFLASLFNTSASSSRAGTRITTADRTLARGGRKAIVIKRNRKQFHEERGWRLRGNVLRGWYRTKSGAFEGRIETPFSRKPRYFVIAPPQALLNGPHGACFKEVKKGVYRIHWSEPPDGVNTGILRMEHYLYEAFS